MSDNVTLPGTGAVVASDDIGSGVQAQYVKLMDGASAGTALIGGDATNGLDVDVTRLPALVAGTANIGDVDVLTLPYDVAHDAADSGNPIKIGGKASATPSTATMVADADRVNFVADVDGMQLVRNCCTLGDILSERVSITSGTSTALSTFGATASSRNYITTIIVYNDTTVNDFVDIRDGTGGSVLATIPLPAKGGAVVQFPVPLRQPTANTALAYDVNTGGSTIYLTFVGFKSKV